MTREARRRQLGLPAGRILVYQGSIGTWYLLTEMVAFVRRAKQRWPDLLWLILAPDEHTRVREACMAAGLREGPDFRLEKLPHHQVPRWLAAADAALFFIRPSYSKISSCPTKFGECLACGLPVVANSGVGDVAETIRHRRVGAVIDTFDHSSFDRALDNLARLLADQETPARCRQAAEAEFDLAQAVEQYDAIYSTLAGGEQATTTTS